MRMNSFVATVSAMVVTLATVGALPAFGAEWSDRDAVMQAPRGQDDQAPATLDDAQSPRAARVVPEYTQAPRGAVQARLDDAQAPRGQDAQAPRGQDAQAPRQEDEQAPRGPRA